MKSIVAVDNMWGIGKNNNLLFHLKADMKHFVENTLGKVVVMGSNTLLSFPNAAPLKNRTNIVLWPGGKRDDLILVESLDALLNELKKYNSDDIYVIGGAMMYHTMLPYCDTAIITKVFACGDA
ncbi:MAG: dihydrofolate reductase, partial [Clostridia bacterium]